MARRDWLGADSAWLPVGRVGVQTGESGGITGSTTGGRIAITDESPVTGRGSAKPSSTTRPGSDAKLRDSENPRDWLG